MKRGLSAVAGMLLMSSIAAAQGPVRVACVGDSITYGDQLADREKESYPAVLERLAQGRLVAGNFGVNGATALKNTGRAWTDTSAGQEALAFSPAVVVVMLGINDLAFPDQYARYPADLRDLVARFQSLSSAPRVFVCTLTPIASAERQADANRIIRETMNPAIRAVAAETGAQLIDVAAVFPNRLDLLPDGLHPNPAGAELIARAVLAASAPSQAPQIQPGPVAGPVDVSIRNEAFAAKTRAEEWLARQPAPTGLRDPSARWEGRNLRTPEDVADLLPLLSENRDSPSADLFCAYAALAIALDRIGHETLFLADGQPVAWRSALLHQLVQRQRIDARGGGYWSGDSAGDESAPVRATAYALQAIAAALGP
jgi:lysophospholipase L1-like esterase